MKKMLFAAMSCVALAFAQEDVVADGQDVVVEQEIAVDASNDASSSDTDN